jgi:hypothetical protein
VDTKFRSFGEFYPYYFSEHQDPTCRLLHFTGTALVIATLLATLITRHWVWLLAMPGFGYGFAWVGHLVFEHNRPASFRHPFYSLAGDFVMFRDILIGRVRL